MLLAVVIVIASLSPVFPTTRNIGSVLSQSAVIAVLALAQLLVIITHKSSLVATDNLAGGRLAGTWLADKIPAGSKIALLQGRLGNPSLDDRVKGFKETLGSKGTVLVVVGFDAAPDELAAIKAGEQAASVAQFPAKMGSLGIETAVAAARGQTVETNVDTGTEVVTKENVAQFS